MFQSFGSHRLGNKCRDFLLLPLATGCLFPLFPPNCLLCAFLIYISNLNKSINSIEKENLILIKLSLLIVFLMGKIFALIAVQSDRCSIISFGNFINFTKLILYYSIWLETYFQNCPCGIFLLYFYYPFFICKLGLTFTVSSII